MCDSSGKGEGQSVEIAAGVCNFQIIKVERNITWENKLDKYSTILWILGEELFPHKFKELQQKKMSVTSVTEAQMQCSDMKQYGEYACISLLCKVL